MTKVQAKIAKKQSHLDGLSDDKVSAHMIENPTQPLVVVAIWDVVDWTTDARTGERTPKVALRSNEVLSGQRAIAGRTLMEEQYSERTGQAAPPLTLFDNPDPDAADPAADMPAAPKRGSRRKPADQD